MAKHFIANVKPNLKLQQLTHYRLLKLDRLMSLVSPSWSPFARFYLPPIMSLNLSLAVECQKKKPKAEMITMHKKMYRGEYAAASLCTCEPVCAARPGISRG